MDLITSDMLGTCSKSVTSSKDTILKFNGSSENVKSLIDRLVNYLETLTNKNTIAKVEKRIANLKSKLAIVKVGANSEIELNEKLDRVEEMLICI